MEKELNKSPYQSNTWTPSWSQPYNWAKHNQSSSQVDAGPVKEEKKTSEVDISKFRKTELFIYQYAEAARKLEKSHGVPALVTLAQGALESAWGKKAIGNNAFGIKADKNWKGKKKLASTHEYHSTADKGHRYPEVISITKVTEGRNKGKYHYKVKDYFRDYDDRAEGVLDHSRFLTENKRYRAAFATETPEDFARAVAAAGYATSPTYDEKLIAVINSVRRHWPKEAGPIPIGNSKSITGGVPPKFAADPKVTPSAPKAETATKSSQKASSSREQAVDIGSVGTQIRRAVGEGAPNDKEDVLVVKALMIKAGYDLNMISAVGPKTIGYIKDFQRKELNWNSPDGRVDPGGRTFRALGGDKPAGKSKAKAKPASKVPEVEGVLPYGKEINEIAEDIYHALNKTFMGTGWGTDTKSVKASLERLNKDPKKIEDLKNAYYFKYGLILEDDLKEDLSDSIFWGNQETEALDLLKPKERPTGGHHQGNTKSYSGKGTGAKVKTEGMDDATRTEKIEEMFDAYAELPVSNGYETVKVVSPYHINANATNRKKKAEANRAANSGVKKLLSDLRKSGKITGNTVIAKATPGELTSILEEAVKRGLVAHEAEAMHKFLKKYGLSADCSGFVSQTLNFLQDGNKVVDDHDPFKRGYTGTGSLRGGQGDFDKVKISDLKPGDTIFLEGHVRIAVEVVHEGNITYVKEAESTAHFNTETNKNGFMKRWWKYDGKKKYYNYKGADGDHPQKDDKDWKASTERNTFGRYTKLRDKDLGIRPDVGLAI